MKKVISLILATLSIANAHPTPMCNDYTAPGSTLVWKPCTQEGFKGVECAQFTVPINWDDCSSERINLTAARVPTKSKNRIGSFFLRFGGPGIYTSNALKDGAAANYGELAERFDLTVLDNRGTGLNYPVNCDLDLWNQDFNYFPKTEDEYNTVVEQYARAGQSCVEKTGPIIHHMDALTHAKDLEALRVLLDEPLSIYALSWGSQAISQYAETFPNNIRAMILDGNVPHYLDNVDYGLSETAAMALTSQRVFGWASTNKKSPLYGQDTVQIFRDIIKQAEQKPLHSSACEGSKYCRAEVKAQDILGAMESWSEYPSTELYYNTSKCLADMQKGDGSCIATTIWTEETAKTAYESSAAPWTQAAIGCQDWLPDTTWEAYRDWDRMTSLQAIPVNEAYHGNIQLFCPKWPTAVTNPPNLNPTKVNTSAPLLIVNALWDPATGYDHAVSMHRHFPNSVLLTRNGEGHGSLAFPGAAKVMTDYLVNLTLPEPNTVTDEPIGTFDVFIKDP